MASDTHSASHGAEQAVSACVDSYGSALGMPQLCGEWFGNQIFWLVITLVAIYFLLSRIALPRIAAILAERQGMITNAIANAEDFKARAALAEEAYNKALADARAEAQSIAAETRAQIQAELDKAIAKADEEIAAKAAESEKAIAAIHASAMANVNIVAQDAAASIVAALGSKADDKAVTAAVEARMKG